MDPIYNLAKQREIAARILELHHGDDDDGVASHMETLASKLAELVQALDEWRLKGGFDPYSTR